MVESLISIIKYITNLSNATDQRAESGNLPMAIDYPGYASHPEVGLVLSGGKDKSGNKLQSVVQTQDGSR
jgi:hypothetical protein